MKHQTSDISVSDIGQGKSDIGRQTSDIRILLFLSDSFDVETINTFILTSVVSSKPYPISDQKDQNLYPLSDRNGPKNPRQKTLPDRAAHTYMACIREYPPGPQLFSPLEPSRKKMTVTLVGLAQALGDQHTPAHCMTAFVLFCFEDFFTPKT